MDRLGGSSPGREPPRLYLVGFKPGATGELSVDLTGQFYLRATHGVATVVSSTGGAFSTTSTVAIPIPLSDLLGTIEQQIEDSPASAEAKRGWREQVRALGRHLTLENAQKLATLARTIQDALR